MTNLPQINKEKIAGRIQDIKEATSKLEQYRTMTLNEFEKDRDNFPLASYWLRIAIEAVLTIGIHTLSRLPSNGKDKDYTEVILSLGDYEVIPKDFAQKIKGMAGYRNRLVHLYWKVTPEEILTTIKDNLDDFDEFIGHIRNFLKQIKN